MRGSFVIVMKDKEKILIKNSSDLKRWLDRLNCPECLLRYCMDRVGNSAAAVEAFWSMNKNWLLERHKLTTITESDPS